MHLGWLHQPLSKKPQSIPFALDNCGQLFIHNHYASDLTLRVLIERSAHRGFIEGVSKQVSLLQYLQPDRPLIQDPMLRQVSAPLGEMRPESPEIQDNP